MSHSPEPRAWSRRALLRRSLLLAVGAATGGAMNACSRSGTTTPAAPASLSPARLPDGQSKTLLAYFSRAGENYYYGGRRNLEVGNTEVVARLIAERATVDVYRVEAAQPYPQDYEATRARHLREQQDDARPALATATPAMDAYDTVLLGSPVWNVGAPMIMHTLVEELDLAGRTVLPFVTYAVSGMGRVAREYQALRPGATIGTGLAVRGEQAQQAGRDVEAWLRELGFMRDRRTPGG